MKKVWYCVTSSFYNDGRVVAAITATEEAGRKPASRFTETRRCDIYNDWFGSVEEAKEFIDGCRKA